MWNDVEQTAQIIRERHQEIIREFQYIRSGQRVDAGKSRWNIRRAGEFLRASRGRALSALFKTPRMIQHADTEELPKVGFRIEY